MIKARNTRGGFPVMPCQPFCLPLVCLIIKRATNYLWALTCVCDGSPIVKVVRDECLKNWKFVERDIEFGTECGSGYPSGEHTQHAHTHHTHKINNDIHSINVLLCYLVWSPAVFFLHQFGRPCSCVFFYNTTPGSVMPP